jgi:hypothetical protein
MQNNEVIKLNCEPSSPSIESALIQEHLLLGLKPDPVFALSDENGLLSVFWEDANYIQHILDFVSNGQNIKNNSQIYLKNFEGLFFSELPSMIQNQILDLKIPFSVVPPVLVINGIKITGSEFMHFLHLRKKA